MCAFSERKTAFSESAVLVLFQSFCRDTLNNTVMPHIMQFCREHAITFQPDVRITNLLILCVCICICFKIAKAVFVWIGRLGTLLNVLPLQQKCLTYYRCVNLFFVRCKQHEYPHCSIVSNNITFCLLFSDLHLLNGNIVYCINFHCDRGNIRLHRIGTSGQFIQLDGTKLKSGSADSSGTERMQYRWCACQSNTILVRSICREDPKIGEQRTGYCGPISDRTCFRARMSGEHN